MGLLRDGAALPSLTVHPGRIHCEERTREKQSQKGFRGLKTNKQIKTKQQEEEQNHTIPLTLSIKTGTLLSCIFTFRWKFLNQ